MGRDGHVRGHVAEVLVPADEGVAFHFRHLGRCGGLALVDVVVAYHGTVHAHEGDGVLVQSGKDCGKGQVVVHGQQARVVRHVVAPAVEPEAFLGDCREGGLSAVLVPAAACDATVCLFVNSNIHLEEQRVLTLELHQIILVHLAVSLVGMFQYESSVIGRVPREPGGCAAIAP